MGVSWVVCVSVCSPISRASVTEGVTKLFSQRPWGTSKQCCGPQGSLGATHHVLHMRHCSALNRKLGKQPIKEIVRHSEVDDWNGHFQEMFFFFRETEMC